MGSTEAIYALPERNEEERVANRRVEIEILKK
jgi:outer membrane protein OmpA-like peptidoglycan-associated protein